jgi:anti-anti-sigma factor
VSDGVSELQVERRELEGVVLLYPKGFVNAHTVRLFESEIQKALEERRYRIVVSCAGLTYIASAGLGALMGVIEEIRHHGGDIRLADLNDTVRNIFEILGFNHLYRIFPSEVEAIVSFREEGQGGGSVG